MKVLIQVVKKAKVRVNEEIVSSIGTGSLLFVGIEKNDTEEILQKMASKIAHLRIIQDENGKTNLSILDKKYEILSISQFTLCALLDGRRPSFSNAMNAQMAKDFYLKFNQMLKNLNMIVKEGVFQTEMEVELINDGPFTIYIDSNNL